MTEEEKMVRRQEAVGWPFIMTKDGPKRLLSGRSVCLCPGVVHQASCFMFLSKWLRSSILGS